MEKYSKLEKNKLAYLSFVVSLSVLVLLTTALVVSPAAAQMDDKDTMMNNSSNVTLDVELVDVDERVEEGDPLFVEFRVENVGNESETQEVAVENVGTKSEERLISLDVGESVEETVRVSTNPRDVGDHDVVVKSENDTDTMSVTIQDD